jgi:protein-S-isoprenylcysteine O-methyltransferase Ste14
MILVLLVFKPINLHNYNLLVNLFGLALSLLGEVVRIISVGFSFYGTSGRESYLKAENLNTSGIYSIVRNPLYVGNFLIFMGLLIVFSNGFAMMAFAVFLWVQIYFIILVEEEFLKKNFGDRYDRYCSQVNRIIPNFKDYVKNKNPFRLKKAIFKESDSVFNMLMMFILILLYKEKVFKKNVEYLNYYIIIGSCLIVIYLTVKIVKKRKTLNF